MDEIWVFLDGSVNNKTKVGFGAYIITPPLDQITDSNSIEVKTRAFRDTSSTKLELQIMLVVLGELIGKYNKVIIYTDSQNIVGLSGRREVLERNQYKSKSNRLLNNHDLYRQFYHLTDQLNCEFIKVKGHQSLKDKSEIDRLFTLVDRAARKAMKTTD